MIFTPKSTTFLNSNFNRGCANIKHFKAENQHFVVIFLLVVLRLVVRGN